MMPIRTIRKGASKKAKRAHASATMREFHKGNTFAATARKFGKKRALKQMIAVGLKSGRLARRKKK